jgi:hypothetical protein
MKIIESERESQTQAMLGGWCVAEQKKVEDDDDICDDIVVSDTSEDE